jgi:hypothetical protein
LIEEEIEGRRMGAESTIPMQRGRPFRPGQSGNPAGRPKGARNRATVAAEALLEGEAEALTRKAIELALAGDVLALRLCLERIVPPRKERPIALPLPAINSGSDVPDAIATVLAAVGEGSVTPGEACTMMALIDAQRRALEAEAVEKPVVVPTIHISFVKPPQYTPLALAGPRALVDDPA